MTATTSGNVSIAGEYAVAAFAREQATAATMTWTHGTSWANFSNDGSTSTRDHNAVDTYASPPSGGTLSDAATLTSAATSYGAGVIAVLNGTTPWLITSGPPLNQPCSQPAGFRTVLLRAGLAMASVIPLAVAAPPPPVTSGPPVPALTQPVSIHRTLPPAGCHAQALRAGHHPHPGSRASPR